MYARRDVLRAGATLGLMAASPWLRAANTDGLITRTIASTQEALPVIGAGTSGSFEVQAGSAQYQQLKVVLKAFFEGGGKVIDTSPNYGGADAILGQLLEEGGWRQQCFIATKIAANSRADAQEQWAGTLRSLRTDKVELLQVHNLRQWQIQLPYARELKQQGKTRYVGITHYLNSGHDDVAEIVRREPLDFIQINYSVNAPDAARTLLPLCQEKGVAVLINRAFDDGRLFARVKDMPLPGWAGEAGIGSWAQLFLKFAISHPAVTTVIPATGRPDRQLDQLKAGHGPLLTQAQQQALIEQFA
ncbi:MULTISPECIES: aldo/keto reductase [Pseudomonas]|uniref:Aldo/keto reductase n=1 Tax=Pseudomonas taiwanensis TaxID=470150 RepID=A0ABR6VAT9_9PSED|nr:MULTISPECIES: aldo/keto reductase [Pseudomonas]AVD90439.1 aldo/keto reductase [Pseudomonas sp. SWI44]MBC3477263.1 aldo/keto reductase [Pseudomonas taiwanensis]MBC3491690.1 aldo/keto reductase [Pseudomonas taiwanensis]MDT8921489.1 aldo/keto reductase [Pseudomonas taiwanensis]WEZ91026.1 aldo/keto reductase [Pseudomonas sp. NyZ480]